MDDFLTLPTGRTVNMTAVTNIDPVYIQDFDRHLKIEFSDNSKPVRLTELSEIVAFIDGVQQRGGNAAVIRKSLHLEEPASPQAPATRAPRINLSDKGDSNDDTKVFINP